MALLIFKAKLFLNVLWILMKCMSEKVRERERRGRREKEGGRKEKEGGRREKRGGSREKPTPCPDPPICLFAFFFFNHGVVTNM